MAYFGLLRVGMVASKGRSRIEEDFIEFYFYEEDISYRGTIKDEEGEVDDCVGVELGLVWCGEKAGLW